MESVFEKAGITYTLAEDGMYYPDLELNEDEEPHYGKYGRIRKAFLKEYRHGLYMELLLSGKLVMHLNKVDNEAHEQVELMVRQMAEKRTLTKAGVIRENLELFDEQLEYVRLSTAPDQFPVSSFHNPASLPVDRVASPDYCGLTFFVCF